MRAMTNENFVIIDPSLRDFRGHHYMLSDLASQSAERAGMHVAWLVADPASQIPPRDGVAITPWFSMSMYDAYKPPAQKASQRGLAAKFRSVFSGKRSESKSAPDPAEIIKPELQRAFEHYRGDGRKTRFFVHTADGAIYRALSALRDEIAADRDLTLHVCTPYDPVGVMPNRGPHKDIQPAIERLISAGVVGRQIHLHAENPFLAEHLSALWKTSVASLEIPVDAGARVPISGANTQLRRKFGIADDAFVISSLGPARLEKGFDKLPEIICAWRASARDASGGSVHFALHAAPQIIGRHPQIAQALDAIKSENDGSVTLLEDPLSDKDYAALLDISDAVILPYDAQLYRVRSSGAVAEAIATGKIIIASKGSYPARCITPGAGECADSPAEYVGAIAKIVSDSASYVNAAARAAARYENENSLEDYVQKIVRAEN